MKVLLVIPPFTQVNTAYPSTAQLAGFLRSNSIDVLNLDLSIKVILKIFSAAGLEKIFSLIKNDNPDEETGRMIGLADNYINIIDPAIEFLQGKNPNLAYSIIHDDFLPKGNAFAREVNEQVLFGELGIQDKAKFYVSMMLEDLTNLIRSQISSHFSFSRYAERISRSLKDFQTLKSEIMKTPNLIEKFIIEETLKSIEKNKPGLVCYSVPFPGNLLGALVSAQAIKQKYPDIKIAMGGGYVNTELRKLKDPSIFDYIDFLTFDDGELPLLNIVKNLTHLSSDMKWVRTLVRQNEKLLWLDDADPKNVKHNDLSAPDYTGIEPDEYLSMIEILNPMHRLWSDGFWNKITIAHGCYWHQCTFCDTTLDYIGRYEPASAALVVDWIENLVEQTGRRTFHFTDEAAPPKLLKEIAIEILKRKLKINWWGNIRFEKSFSADLCRLLAASGCIAVTGGIEVADDRLLKLIKKGVSIEQAAAVCSSFQKAGIMVHAYMMYAFPSQTEQELINSLEVVRQFFQHNLFQSGYWHQFALTCHSPVAKDSDKFGIKIESPLDNDFANNDLVHTDSTGINYDNYSAGLKKAIYNFMHGIGLDWPVQNWFEFKTSKPDISSDIVFNSLTETADQTFTDSQILIWTGGKPIIVSENDNKVVFELHSNSAAANWTVDKNIAAWLADIISKIIELNAGAIHFKHLRESFPGDENEFRGFLQSETWNELRELGLIIV